MERVKYLESLLNQSLEDKHWSSFTKYARYLGNGVYTWDGLVSNDPRELFLMGVLEREKIDYERI